MGYTPGQRPWSQLNSNWQGIVDAFADLPNSAGSPYQFGVPNVQLGDLAWVKTGAPGLYQCVDPTLGAAVWTLVGSGGGGGPDHFAPKWLVGNVPNGDSPVPFSSGGFNYIPDTGNCAGLNAALIAAAAFKNSTVEYRPGIYDMNLAGAPAVPMVVPAGCKLTGPGIIPDPQGPPLGPILGRTAGNQGVFVCAGDGWAIRDTFILSFTLQGPQSFIGSTELILIKGAGQIQNVGALVIGDNPLAIMRTVVAIDSGGPVECDGMYAQGPTFGFGSGNPADWGRVFWLKGTTKDFVSLRHIACAADVCVQQDVTMTSLVLSDVQMLGAVRRGIWQTVPSPVGMSGDCAIFAAGGDCLGAELMTDANVANTSQIDHCRFFGSAQGMNQPAVLVHGPIGASGGRARVQGNLLSWMRSGQGPLGNSVIELGASGSAEQVDRCSVEGNIIQNLGGGGVEVASPTCNKNIVGGGSMEVAFGPVATDFGTATFFYPIAV